MRRRRVFLLHRDGDLGNTRAVNLSQKLDLIDVLPELVFFQILHHLDLDHLDIQRVAVDVLDVVLDVEEFTRAKDRLHDLGVSCLDSLLGHGRYDAGAFGVARLVFDGPFATEDALVFFPEWEEVGVTVIAPAITVVCHEADKFLIVLRGLIKFVLVHSYMPEITSIGSQSSSASSTK